MDRQAPKKFPKKMEDSSAETVPPPWEDVLLFFESKSFPEMEAQKFYNYFESIGWLVGGKSQMKDWKAAARNWMLKAVQFAPSSPSPQPNICTLPIRKIMTNLCKQISDTYEIKTAANSMILTDALIILTIRVKRIMVPLLESTPRPARYLPIGSLYDAETKRLPWLRSSI